MKLIQGLITNIPIACKIIYVVSTILYIVGIIFNGVPLILANLPQKIYVDKQIWRLFFTYFSKGVSVFSIISFFVDFLLIRFFFTKIEKTYSTSFFVTQIFIQNLILQVLFTLISGVLLYLDLLQSFLISYGWTSLVIVFSFKILYKTQEQKMKIICFEIPKRYLPYVIGIISLACNLDQFLSVILSLCLAYIQFRILKRKFIRFSLTYYKKIDNCMPNFVKNRKDYIKVSDVEENLMEECQTSEEVKKEVVVMNEVLQRKQDSSIQRKQDLSRQKRNRKVRKVGKNKSNLSGEGNGNVSGGNSVQLKDELQSGKETRQGETEDMNAVETNENLDRKETVQP